MSSVVHIGVVFLLVIFSMWSRFQHLDEKEGHWETKVSPSCIILCVFIMLILTKFSVLLCCLQHLEEVKTSGRPMWPLLYYSVCYNYLKLIVILLFTASRWGWRRRRVGDPCVSSLHLHQSTGLCKYWVVKYWSLYVLSNYSMPTDSLIKILTHNPLKQYIVK